MNNQTIKETMIVNGGKMKYCVMLEQEKNKVCIYVNSNNELHFETNRYFDFIQFELNNEVHKIAKEMFLTHLQTEVKTRLLELKQLELILDELGLIGVIRKTLIDNGSLLIDQKDDIVKETIERSSELIKQSEKKINKKTIDIATEAATKVVDETVINIAKKKKKTG